MILSSILFTSEATSEAVFHQPENEIVIPTMLGENLLILFALCEKTTFLYITVYFFGEVFFHRYLSQIQDYRCLGRLGGPDRC